MSISRGQTTSAAIEDYKRTLVSKLVSSDEIIQVMGNTDIEENDEAAYKYIFPYFHIPDTIESAHSYICMRANMTGVSYKNDSVCNYSLIIWVIVNQEIMRMEGVGGSTRMDYLSSLIEQELSNSEAFGAGKLKIISNTADDVDMKHRCRKLVFITSDNSFDGDCG